jgi:hypothetical protein
VHHFGEIAPYLCTNAVQGVPVQEYDFQAIEDRLPQLSAVMVESGMWFTPTANLLWYVVENYANLEHLIERPRTRYAPPRDVAGWRNPESNFVYIAFGTDEARLDRAKRYLDAQRRVLQALHEAGVPLLAGTDSGAAPGSVNGFDLPLELELLVECGLTPFEALTTATRNPAEFLDEADEWGTIGVGRNADLVLLRSNPLDDITRTADIDGVMLGGRWLPRGELDAMLDEVAAVLRSDDQQTQSRAKP